MLEAEIAEARKTRARAGAEYRAAENVIETHDRPLRRRKHEHEIRSAQRELQRRRVRTRIARLEQPAAIVDTLGPRPRGAKKAQAWDQAAGRVHQHQAAFDIQDGIGDWPGRYDRSAYGVSYEAVDEAIWKLRPQRPTMEVARPEIGLSGIEM